MKQFAVQKKGERKPSVLDLSQVLERHRDAPEVLEWVERAPVGGGLITDGEDMISIRRVS